MADGQANVRFEAIAELEVGLGRFARTVLSDLQAAETTIERTLEAFEERRSELHREVASCREEIANAEDDDNTSWARERLETAEEALESVLAAKRDFESDAQRYRQHARRLEELCTKTTPAARALLRQVCADLVAYFALQPDSAGAGHAAGAAPVLGNADAVRTTTSDDLKAFALPPGFSWVPIAEIDIGKELIGVQSEEEYKKVDYAEMRRGLDALRQDVLPAMNRTDAPMRSDDFALRDAAAGVAHEHGLQRVYDAFFGDEPIVLERGHDASEFSVTNGRHRIKAAIDAGWTVVPAKTDSLRSR